MYIVCLGDSICYGDGVRSDQAWVSLLAGELARALPGSRVRNAGINGETAQDGLQRLHPLLGPPVPDLLYVQFGLNEAWLNAYSAAEYTDYVREIVFQALESGVRAVIVGTNHPVWVEHDMYGGASYPPRVRQFNAALRDCFSVPPERLVLVDIERHWDRLGDKEAQVPLLQPDGVHLSVSGNRVYADMLVPLFATALGGLK